MRPRSLGMAVAVAGILAAGCTPMTEQEKAYHDQQREQRVQREALIQALQGGTPAEHAIGKVKDSPAPEGGEGTMEEWVVRTVHSQDRSVLYPRWTAHPLAAGAFEVQYTYTVLKDDYKMVKGGYAWSIDPLLEAVQGPRRMEGDEMETDRPGREVSAQRQRSREDVLETLE